MTTKANPGEFNCYDAAYPDEPIFTILGRDPAFPATVEFWKQERVRQGKYMTDDDIDRLAAIGNEIKSAKAWREANLDPFGDGTPTWKLPRQFEDSSKPFHVERALGSASGLELLEALRTLTAKEHLTYDDWLKIHTRLCTLIDLVKGLEETNTFNETVTSYKDPVRSIETYDKADPSTPGGKVTLSVGSEFVLHLTPGEKVIVDSAPEDLAHQPEVPPHRFSMFRKGENYAYARGLEINPSHLPTALDALLKDGWKLVSLFGQTDSANVGFIFERVAPVIQPTTVKMSVRNEEFEEALARIKADGLPAFLERKPVARAMVTPEDGKWPEKVQGRGTGKKVKPVTPKIEVHLEGLSPVDSLTLMSVIECRMQWLPQDLRVIGLIAGNTEAAFDFTQGLGTVEKRKTLIKGDCGAMEFGRQQEP